MEMPRTHPALLAALVSLSFPVAATQLLVNGDIARTHDYALPPGWALRMGEASKINIDPAFSKVGPHSLEFDLSAGNGPEWAVRPVPVEAGETLHAGFSYRVDQVFTSGHAAGLLRFWSGPNRTGFLGQVIIQDLIGTTTTGGWVDASTVAEVPIGATHADVTVWGEGQAFGPQGRAFFDAFSLSVVPVPGSPTQAVSPVNGAEGISLRPVLNFNAPPATRRARLYLDQSRLAVKHATESSSTLVETFPILGNGNRYAVTLQPYRQYFWRVDVEDAGGNWQAGNVWSFYTSFTWLEEVQQALTFRFNTLDSRGIGMDTLQIIRNPTGTGYIGTYHNLVNPQGLFDTQLATSPNLLTWTHRVVIAPNSTMGAITWHAPTQSFYFAHEQWMNTNSTSPSRLRFKVYPNFNDLVAGNASRDYLAPIAPFNQSNLEGTPSFESISEDGNSANIAFHYYNVPAGGVDRLAAGTLTNMQSGTIGWTRQVDTAANNKMIALGTTANIGDRDRFRLLGRNYRVQEGQYVRNDFGAWRPFFYDEEWDDYHPLFLNTPNKSRASGNMAVTVLSLPQNREGIVACYFIFSEQSGTSEPGQLVFTYEIPYGASDPIPGLSGEADAITPTLRWMAGAGAESYDVYIGTTFAGVRDATKASPLYRGEVDRPLFTSTALPADTLHYWRVDTYGVDDRTTKGAVWSFRTPVAPPPPTQRDIFSIH
jgi:hypothetical protein